MLTADRPRYVIIEINQALIEKAGEFADRFYLSGHDGAQLAWAFRLRHITEAAVCFDVRLNKAAKVLRMQE
jgi:uncharacterized protein